MQTSKSKLQITSGLSNGKKSKVKLGASTSSQNSSPLMPKRSYKKKGAQANDFGAVPSFGATGLTGES